MKYVEHNAGRLYYDDKWGDIIILTKDLESNGDGIRINRLVGKEIFDSLK